MCAVLTKNASNKIREPAYKPGSVPLLGTVIYLAGRLPGRSSSLPGSRNGPDRSCSPIWPCSRWGLPSQPVTRLLVGSYPAISPLPGPGFEAEPAVSFCCTFPILGPTLRTDLGRWTLPTTVSCGARTFLSPAPPRKRARTPDSDRPADSRKFLSYQLQSSRCPVLFPQKDLSHGSTRMKHGHKGQRATVPYIFTVLSVLQFCLFFAEGKDFLVKRL